ncbi:GntR family transcriptional regulator [Paraburkholderia sp. SUR17]|uniref:GntR family transcriptional regulator n=1 Tax=Paraburkholderia sp. SUR17 TaxID=3034358 RepID=UPI0024080558|nr:GntR family transcriptional regulator [Paraburkholderia sp. SUR17]WEY37678.1 GntR family transcriptional regulator [Paraburkholderia sp. SUR17]
MKSDVASTPRPANDSGTTAPREPLWSQVKHAILSLIQDERLPANAPLPSESDLCQRFSVSRTVVREAMNQLVYEHVIYKRQGKGAFVAGRRESQEFVGSIIGFSDEWFEKHRAVDRRILRQASTFPGARARELLQLPAGDGPESRVVEVSRVLSVEGIPHMLVTISIPEHLVPGLDQVPLQARSLYDVLRRRYGLHFQSADRWIEAVTTTAENAQLLEVTTSTPLIAIESCAHSASGQPIEYWQALCRTDVASLHFQIRR